VPQDRSSASGPQAFPWPCEGSGCLTTGRVETTRSAGASKDGYGVRSSAHDRSSSRRNGAFHWGPRPNSYSMEQCSPRPFAHRSHTPRVPGRHSTAPDIKGMDANAHVNDIVVIFRHSASGQAPSPKSGPSASSGTLAM
jgi:hypothetical protein